MIKLSKISRFLCSLFVLFYVGLVCLHAPVVSVDTTEMVTVLDKDVSDDNLYLADFFPIPAESLPVERLSWIFPEKVNYSALPENIRGRSPPMG